MQRAFECDDTGDFNCGKQTIARGGVVEKDHVPGLFATKVGRSAQHFFQHVAIADRDPHQLQTLCREQSLKPEVCHCGPDHTVSAQASSRSQITSSGKQYSVTVHKLAGSADKYCS